MLHVYYTLVTFWSTSSVLCMLVEEYLFVVCRRLCAFQIDAVASSSRNFIMFYQKHRYGIILLIEADLNPCIFVRLLYESFCNCIEAVPFTFVHAFCTPYVSH